MAAIYLSDDDYRALLHRIEIYREALANDGEANEAAQAIAETFLELVPERADNP